jgi:exodeoxyribonuclease V beta subunit
MIGDPKQAIYAFRGADILHLPAARRATSGRLHSLDTNYRSSKAMVAAVNRVFLQAEARERGGRLPVPRSR